MPTKTYRYPLVVWVRSSDRGSRQAQNRLHRWFELHGHTGAAFGLDFESVGVITGKRFVPALPKSSKRAAND